MIGNQDNLLEIAVRPLADDAELQLAAVAALARTADQSRCGADEAITRWESVDATRKRPLLMWMFVAALIAFSAWAWTVTGKEALIYSRLISVSAMFKYDNDPDYETRVRQLEACLPGTLMESEKTLLLGDPSKGTRVEATKALWQAAPDDPAFYMEYVFSDFENRRKGAAPLEFLETARRLDPGNSWPVYAAGASKRRKSIELVPLSSAEIAAKAIRSWKILDQGSLDECIALLHEASLEPRFDTYRLRMLNLRNDLIPVDDHLSYITASKVCWLDNWGNQSPKSWLAVFLAAAAAKSQQQVAEGDKEGFVRLISDIEVLNRRWVESEIDDAGSEIAFNQGLWMSIPRLHSSAVSLSLPGEVARLDEILNAMKSLRMKRVGEDDARPDGFYGWFDSHSSILLSEFRRFYSELWYPKWNTEDLKPGRMADHELLSRGCCLVVWVIFGLGVGLLGLYRFRLPRLIRRMAVRIGELLDIRDHAWIIGTGVFLPYAYTMAINLLTPLGGRDWSIVGNHLMLPMVQFFGMTVLMLLVPILVIRRRLAMKAAVLGLAGGKSKWEPPAVVCAAILIPISGSLAPSEWYAAFLPLLICLIAFLLAWLLANSFLALFDSDERRLLHRAVVSRALIPAYATAMLLMVLAAPFHKAAERRWFRRDTTMTAVPGFPAVSPYDYSVAEQIRRDLRDVLGRK